MVRLDPQYSDAIQQRVAQLKRDALENKIVALEVQDQDAVIAGFSQLLKQLGPDDRKKIK
ncbi:hypothetical protein MBANPS3_011585 [Mucor bainieri]